MNGKTPEGQSQDEYSLIETMMDELQYEKEYAQPYAIRDTVGKLVMEEFQQERFDYLKETLNQPMKFPWYILMVTECKDSACTGKISGAYQKLIDEKIENATDDAMVVEQMMKVPVKLYEGSYENIKITTPEDLEIAKVFLAKREEK